MAGLAGVSNGAFSLIRKRPTAHSSTRTVVGGGPNVQAPCCALMQEAHVKRRGGRGFQVDFCAEGGYVDQMGYDLSATRSPIEPIRYSPPGDLVHHRIRPVPPWVPDAPKQGL